MAVECKTTLKLIKLLYKGPELEAMLSAWAVFPTLRTDCPNERALKEKLRRLRADRIMRGEIVNS